MSGIARRGRQGGFSLVGAIFIVTVLAALGAFLVTTTGATVTASGRAVAGTLAFFAAHSGQQWATQDIIDNGGAGLDCAPGTVTYTLGTGALAGFDVSVTCTLTVESEGADTVNVYRLTSVGSRGVVGDERYVSARLTATVAP